MTIDFVKELHDKKINFLIGSGASAKALPTLKTKIEKDGNELSFEDIVSFLEDEDLKVHSHLMFSEYYYKHLIIPSYSMDFYGNPNIVSVNNDYKKLLDYIIKLINIKKVDDYKRCNIFTTNYDGFFENAANEIISTKKSFILNDGGAGFKERILSASNFNMQVNHIGVFDSYLSEIPMINLIKVHGSIYWKKKNDEIVIDYQNSAPDILPSLNVAYLDGITKYNDIKELTVDTEDESKLSGFWDDYKQIPIVNPTKWKFNETVFEQHYYQMLRLLSYELEKRDVYLIVYGFSFKDEHIFDLVKRSLTNPHLTVYVFCFNETDFNDLKEKFTDYNNVFFIQAHEKDDISKIQELDFELFLNILKGKQDIGTWKVIR